jgi:CheY-like chemotaxis protein
VDLLLTDVVMPEVGGRELSERLRASYPEVRVLFMSAYTEDEVILQGVRVAEVDFLMKPFNLESLTRSVKEVLARPARSLR